MVFPNHREAARPFKVLLTRKMQFFLRGQRCASSSRKLGRIYRSNGTLQGDGSPLVRLAAYNLGFRPRLLSTFKRHKQFRKTSKQVQNKQTMWRNKLEKVPKKGAEGKYGKSKAERRSYYQKFKRQKKADKSTTHAVPANKFDESNQLLPQIMTEERQHEIAALGDEADMLAHFTAGNDVLASQESKMTKLYDLLLKNREWKKKTQHGYSINSCAGETAKLYLEIDELMYKVDPNSKDFIELLENVVVPKVYDHLGTLADLGEKHLRNKNERKYESIVHDQNYLYAKLVESYATYASYRNENAHVQQKYFDRAIGVYREMFRSGTLPTLPMYEALMTYELLRNNYEGVVGKLHEAQNAGYEITLKMANIHLMACAKVELSPVHHTWGERRTTNHILYLTEKCFVDYFNNVDGFFPNFKTFKALMIGYSRCGDLKNAYRLMSVVDSHSFVDLSKAEYGQMFGLLLEAHNNCIVVPRKERKRVQYEINRLKRIRKAKTLAAPMLDWNFLRLRMFPKREDNAVEKLNEFWSNPFGGEGHHDFLGAGSNIEALPSGSPNDSDTASAADIEDTLVDISKEADDVFLVENDDFDNKEMNDNVGGTRALMNDPVNTVIIEYAADEAKAEAELEGTYNEDDWVENPMDFLKNHFKSPEKQHIEDIGLKELVSTASDVQILRNDYNEESVIESASSCFGTMIQRYDIQPNVTHLNKMLRLFTSLYRLNRAQDFVDNMQTRFGVEPDSKSYKLLIEMYSRSNRLPLAKKVYDESVNKGVGLSSVILQGTMLRSFIRHKSYREALKVMKNMKRRDVNIKERDVYELRRSIEQKTLTYSSGKKVDRRMAKELASFLPEDPNRVRKMINEHLKRRKKVRKVIHQVKF